MRYFKLFLILFISIVALPGEATESSQAREALPNIISLYPKLKDCDYNNLKTAFYRESRSEGEGALYRDVTLTEAGTLAEVLGADTLSIDSVVVRGPINEADFDMLWKCSFYGELRVIDLSNAVVANGKIPESAFFHSDVQLDWDNAKLYIIRLEKLLLPSDITEIDDWAFSYATRLKEVKFPDSLVRIGLSAFTDCRKLTAKTLVFHEGLEEFASQCFYACHGLEGEVVFPESVKYIASAAFYQCYIKSKRLPSSLEFLGSFAFAGCRFEEAILPDNCVFSSGCQFMNNYPLVRAHLPENSDVVPEAIFNECWNLQEVNIPKSAVYIRPSAFEGCLALPSVELPEGVEHLDYWAFRGCDALETVMLPSTVNFIGSGCFETTKNVKRVYCKAMVPPECEPSNFYPNTGPFGTYDDPNWHGMSPDTPLYVPKGTGDLYRSTWGWSYFKNIIETDDFPSLSVSGIDVDGGEEADAPVYDLMGRRVDSPQPGQIYIRAGKKFTVKP